MTSDEEYCSLVDMDETKHKFSQNNDLFGMFQTFNHKSRNLP